VPMVLPIGTDHAKTRIPVFTIWLLLANLTLFLLSRLSAHYSVERILEGLGYVPQRPHPIAVLTHMFMHASFLHLAVNMFFLWLFGSDLEDALGTARFAVFYFISGIAALAVYHVTTILFLRDLADESVVGASGAISGVMGLYAVRFWRYKVKLAAILFIYPRIFRINALVWMALWFLGQLALGISVIGEPDIAEPLGVAFWAHIGGFSTGLGLAFRFKLNRQSAMEYRWADASAWLAKGRFVDAIEAYQDIAKRFPKDPLPLLQIARCWEAAGRKSKIVPAYKKALSVAARQSRLGVAADAYVDLRQAAPEQEPPPLHPQQWLHLGALLQNRGRYGPALEAYRRLADAFPGSEEAPVALLRSSQIFSALGRDAAAARLCTELNQRYPTSTWAELARKELAKLRSEEPR